MIPVTISPIDPKELHQYWSFLRRGIEAIKHRVPSDCIAEDIYWFIRQGAAQAFIVTRGERRLGWFANYVQQRPFSGKRELFLWCAWSIPLRERQPDDNVPEAVAASMEYMRNQARAAGCDSIVHLSSRKGFEKFGFHVETMTYRLRLD